MIEFLPASGIVIGITDIQFHVLKTSARKIRAQRTRDNAFVDRFDREEL
jgi:hypothetical protein